MLLAKEGGKGSSHTFTCCKAGIRWVSPPACLVTSQTQKCVIFDTLSCLLLISVILKCSALLVISELVLVKHFFFSLQ